MFRVGAGTQRDAAELRAPPSVGRPREPGPVPAFAARRLRAASYLTESFRALPGLNFGVFAALILISAPVLGLRPMRAARLDT